MYKQLSKKIAIFFILLSSTASYAKLDNLQATVRTGMIKGSYANPLTTASSSEDTGGGGSNATSNLEGGGFSVMPSLDADLEIFDNFKRSYFVRTSIALDMGTGKMHYNYLGLGTRRYYKGAGIQRIFQGDGTTITAIPKVKKYYGFDFGLSRVSVVNFGTVLSAVSTGIDFGGHWGYTKQVSENWGLNFEAGLSYAYGISTISSSGMNIKVLFGATFPL
ncbi:hypothetical protein [Halobacteriovorax sp.]|uniref:hypothetical protein n=1 Tax=Halobacteriovorax sp. TaxID=2020862 RepID=UPI0035621023